MSFIIIYGLICFELLASTQDKNAFYPCAERHYNKTCVNGHSQKDRKLLFKTNDHLMQVESIAECSKGSILQFFRSSLSYNLSLRCLFLSFFSGRFAKVLRYLNMYMYA